MSKPVFFLNMFPDYQPTDPLVGFLSQAVITGADIDPETRSVSVIISSETYIPQALLSKAAGDICAAYSLRQLQIEPVYPPSQLQAVEPPRGTNSVCASRDHLTSINFSLPARHQPCRCYVRPVAIDAV